MTTIKKYILSALAGLSLIGLPAIGQQAPASATSSPQPTATQEAALTNADVVKLCKLDLGDEVVIAKINQAKAVDFKLDTDSLVALKQESVSKGVITAMLNRTSAPPANSGPAAGSARGNGGWPGTLPAGFSNPGDEGVVLRTTKGDLRLQSVQGDISMTYAFVVMLTFLDFPGLRADARITDRRPTIIVRSSKSPRGRVFLVKCESNEKDANRSVKVGKGSMFGQKTWSTPDNDWTIDFNIKELPDNTWELTPKKDAKPGEYGVLFKGGFYGILAGTQGELFDFGVD
jgi:hypothetical protein